MRKISSSFYSVLCVAVMALSMAVTACSPYEPAFKSVAEDAKTEREISYYNYVAADKLIRQLRGSVADEAPILVGTIADVSKLETTSPLGRVMTEHVSTRFVQRGFSVTEMTLRNSVNIQNTFKGEEAAGQFLMSRDVRAVAGEHKAVAVVSGTYAVAEEEVLVSIRVVDVQTGKVLASTDYDVPRTDDVNALLGSGGTTSFFGKGFEY